MPPSALKDQRGGHQHAEWYVMFVSIAREHDRFRIDIVPNQVVLNMESIRPHSATSANGR